jgi:hypothetical protein
MNEETGKLDPINGLIVGGVGSGKTLALEEYARYFYEHGYTVISLSDVKDGLEFGFSAFEPSAPYMLRQINMFGAPKHAQKIKVYHPFTFDIPTDELPEINFYGINIKNLTEIDLKFLAESNENKRSIQIIMETAEKLKSDEGIHHLIFSSETQTESLINSNKGGVKYRSDKADDFFTKTKIGTEKTASEMVAYFKPFLKDYCLLPKNNSHNLNIKELMNDQEHYHIFTTKWIISRRLKAFFILHLLQELINNEQYAKHPVCIILEEIRFLTPNSSDGFANFLSEEIKSTMTRMRNMGKGFAILSTTQVYRDVSPVVIDSFNSITLGKISSFKELEFISKALKMSSTDMNTIKNLDVGEFAVYTKEENVEEKSLNKIRFFMPPHSHKEQGKNFFSEWQKYFPERMHVYTDLIEEMKAEKQRIEEDVTVLKDKENISKRESAKKNNEERRPNRNYETEEKLEKQKEKGKKTSERLMNLVWETYNSASGKEKEYGVIAQKVGMFLGDGKPNKMGVLRLLERRRKQESLKSEKASEDEGENEDAEERM